MLPAAKLGEGERQQAKLALGKVRLIKEVCDF
jgi:hypothetical protein